MRFKERRKVPKSSCQTHDKIRNEMAKNTSGQEHQLVMSDADGDPSLKNSCIRFCELQDNVAGWVTYLSHQTKTKTTSCDQGVWMVHPKNGCQSSLLALVASKHLQVVHKQSPSAWKRDENSCNSLQLVFTPEVRATDGNVCPTPMEPDPSYHSCISYHSSALAAML